jgi:hypothetical protein
MRTNTLYLAWEILAAGKSINKVMLKMSLMADQIIIIITRCALQIFRYRLGSSLCIKFFLKRLSVSCLIII